MENVETIMKAYYDSQKGYGFLDKEYTQLRIHAIIAEQLMIANLLNAREQGDFVVNKDEIRDILVKLESELIRSRR